LKIGSKEIDHEGQRRLIAPMIRAKMVTSIIPVRAKVKMAGE